MKKLVLTMAFVATLFSCQNDKTEEVTKVEDNGNELISARRCFSEEMLQLDMKKDPTLARRMQEIEIQTANSIVAANASRLVNGVIEIPVVFNILYNTAADNISQSQCQSQLDVLNRDFNGTNTDYNSSNPFNSVKGSIAIRFVLDQIIRKQSTRTIWYSEDGFMKVTSQGGLSPVSPTTKLNYWVVNNLQSRTQGQLLGYAQFPGGASSTDGIVCGKYCTGTNGAATAPFNLGRTATHEIGHWLNLRHIWGDATCGSDLVSDTPTHNAQNFGNPGTGHRSTCSGTPLEMYMNYMDYVDDNVMYMFSKGQASRMNATLAVGGSRSSFR